MTPSEQSGSLTPETSEEQTDPTVAAASEEPHPKGRIRRAFSTSRELVRIAYRDPEHVSERLTLYTARRLGDPSQPRDQTTRERRLRVGSQCSRPWIGSTSKANFVPQAA